MIHNILLGLLIFSSIILLLYILFGLISNNNLGSKFQLCVPHSQCNKDNKDILTHNKDAKQKCKPDPNNPPINPRNPNVINQFRECYQFISPTFKDVYIDIFDHFKDKDDDIRKKNLINMKSLYENLFVILFAIMPVIILSITAREKIIDLVDYEIFDIPLMTIILICLYFAFTTNAVYLTFNFVKMTKINQHKDSNIKNIILSMDDNSKSTGTNYYSKIYNKISVYGLIAMILLIILLFFSAIILILGDEE